MPRLIVVGIPRLRGGDDVNRQTPPGRGSLKQKQSTPIVLESRAGISGPRSQKSVPRGQ